jgi:hypothetical protein
VEENKNVQKVVLTQQGLDKILEELTYLKTEKRKEVAKKIQIAKDLGDLKENAEYEAAKDDYQRNNLKIIKTYLNKFAEGGRNSMLWNGFSTITAEENMIVF